MSSTSSYLIIGAGVFGASTALYLKQSDPSIQVTLVDRTPFPNPSAASHDLNKIIRADYGDVTYVKLALDAQKLWRQDPVYKPFYHETGMIYAEDIGMGPGSLRCHEILGEETLARFLSVDAVRKQFPEFETAKFDGVDSIFYNPTAGWGEAEPALRSAIQAAVDAGVTYVEATIAKLLLGKDGECKGAVTAEGGELTAEHTILATGARTATILADTAPKNEALQVNGRVVAAAAVSCAVRVAPEKIRLYQDSPVFANILDHTHAEAIPLNSNGLLKFNYELSFTNIGIHEASGQQISCPPDAINQSTWTPSVPETLKQECLKAVTNTYGPDLDGLTIESYRMCWDAVTPNQDWIISPHPACRKLFITTGGSFHAWKFLPVLGTYVTQMLRGTLEAELARKWSWDRGVEGGANTMYIPLRDLKDMKNHV